VGPAARAAVEHAVETVRDDPALAGIGRVRWVVGDNLHLTLRFLGPTAADRVAEAEAACRAAAAGRPPFPVRLAGAGGFPSTSRPRVVWVGVADGAAELTALAAAIDAELAARGWAMDTRPFRAHLSIGRADGVPGAGRAVEALAAASDQLDAAWTADAVVLYRSEVGRGPARYTAIATVPLGGAPAARGDDAAEGPESPGGLPDRSPLE
jgi:2'-5' RNA ligase